MTTTTVSKKRSVNFISLGCPKNLVDSEVMLGLLDKDDFEIVSPDRQSDITVINTCGFVEESKKESIDTILEVATRKKKGQLKLLVVTGCLSQRYKEELPKLLPEVDLFLGTGDYPKLPGLIRHKLAGRKGRDYVTKPEFVPDHLMPKKQITPFYTKYVKISEGCSHKCSFCVIPFMRGTLKSRLPESISEEIRIGIENGVKEFNLVGQDLNEYGRDLKEQSLYKLLESLKNLSGKFWLRLMYLYPLQFPDRLVDLIARHPHVIPYVDIPLQHISDNMLKKMNRGSSSRYIYRLVEQLKTKIPNITLRTTFIVGHPGETKKDFEELLTFVRTTEFDRVGVFQYSPEEGTPSFEMNGKVEKHVKENRYHELMRIQQKISLKKNKTLVGKTLKTLLEGPSKESDLFLSARHQGQAPEIDGEILIRKGLAKIGDFCDVKIVEAHEYDLVGEIVTESDIHRNWNLPRAGS